MGCIGHATRTAFGMPDFLQIVGPDGASGTRLEAWNNVRPTRRVNAILPGWLQGNPRRSCQGNPGYAFLATSGRCPPASYRFRFSEDFWVGVRIG